VKARRLIILAAGRGTRLGDAAGGRPKCMTPLRGRALLEWQIEAARTEGFRDVTVVRGFQAPMIDVPGVAYAHNPVFDRTNMVYTLLSARDRWRPGFVLSYGDIVYEPRVLSALARRVEAPAARRGGVAVVVDLGWRAYWAERFDDPLQDAETLRMEGGRIVEIGGRPRTLDEIQGQYIGMSAFWGGGLEALGDLLDREALAHAEGRRVVCPQRAFPDLYVTDVVQALIGEGRAVDAVPIDRGWFEIDTPRDLAIAERGFLRGAPAPGLSEARR
jgi:choline kinase